MFPAHTHSRVDGKAHSEPLPRRIALAMVFTQMLYPGISRFPPGDQEEGVSGCQMAGLGDGDSDTVERRGPSLMLALGASFCHGQDKVAADADPLPHLPSPCLLPHSHGQQPLVRGDPTNDKTSMPGSPRRLELHSLQPGQQQHRQKARRQSGRPVHLGVWG